MIFAAVLLQLALAQTPARPLIDVPFVAQTPELCGGAAVSMVLRYWGQRDVFPQDFAALVTPGEAGILTGTLAAAVRDRGWRALVDPADSGSARSRVRAELDRGRPIISLIEVAPGVHHYIVIVGSTDKEIVFHDPARAPFRVLDWTAFDQQWAGANRWMMVALPPDGFVGAKPAADSGAPSPPAAVTPCSALVAHAIETAVAGHADDAERELEAARRLCPTDAAAWRETAGLRFTQKRWADANQLATMATRLAPSDSYSWELAGSSRFLMSDATGALAAWNRIGEPRIDAITVHGAERTRVPVVVDASGLDPRMLLTPDKLTQAIRRLRDLPVASSANIKFEPVAGGLANVDAVIVEREAWPHGRNSWLLIAARPALQREVRVEVAGLSGAGESAFAAWRFARHRQKVSGGLAFPSPSWLAGVTTFSAMWEEQVYAPSLALSSDRLRQTRRRAGLQLSGWASGVLQWQGGAALDRFDQANFLTADGTLLARSRGDRAAFSVFAGAWQPLSDGERFTTAGARAQLRTSAEPARHVLSITLEMQRASSGAPLALWPSAGTGVGTERASILRGHQLVEDGFVSGDAFGRQLLSGSIEYVKPVKTVRAVTIGIAAFVDAARASLRRNTLDPVADFGDAGVGFRFWLPGNLGGIRVDFGHPIGDGRLIFSGGWIAPWPK